MLHIDRITVLILLILCSYYYDFDSYLNFFDSTILFLSQEQEENEPKKSNKEDKNTAADLSVCWPLNKMGKNCLDIK